ncbi:MAG: hypothetical protein K2O85_02330 [Helicobacter sp.]|nr:hypothetical protein [Helicobacter sp.]
MRQLKYFILLLIMGFACNLWAKEEKSMRIQMQFDNQHFVFVLADNPSARDLWNLLPLELRFSDYVGKEKIASLPHKLNTRESSDYDPQSGDFFYFAPWGNVGIFYVKQPPYPGLIKLGAIENHQETFIQAMQNQKKDFVVSITKIPNSD